MRREPTAEPLNYTVQEAWTRDQDSLPRLLVPGRHLGSELRAESLLV